MVSIAATTRHPLYLLLLGGVVAAVGAALRYDFPLRIAITLLFFGALWNFVTVHVGETSLFRLPGDYFAIGGAYTLEAALYGALNGISIALILTAFVFLTQLLSPRDVVRLTPPALYEVGLVLAVALAFLPQGRETLQEIQEAQELRGHRSRGLRDFLPILLPLMIKALERALDLAETMEARGFSARREKLSRWVVVLLLVSLLAALGGVLGGMVNLAAWLLGGLWLLAVLLLLAALYLAGKDTPSTNYRAAHLSAAEWGAVGTALAALLVWGGLQLLAPQMLVYSVYPRVTLPEFELLGALPVLLLLFPALVPLWAAPAVEASPEPVSPLATAEFAGGGHVVSPAITFERVTFLYPGSTEPVLRDMSFSIAPGAFVLICGPSGSGKSTLLRCVNGLVPHSSGGTIAGVVRVGGVDALRSGPRVLAALVGFVPQSPESGFVADMVDDEIAFALANAGLSVSEISTRIAAALSVTGCAHLLERRLDSLSGGERQRVAVAAALALQPAVLLLDEPLSQLDPQGAADVVQFLRRLNARGITIIVAEHRLERLLPCATQVVTLPGDGSFWAGAPREAALRLAAPPPLVALGRKLGWSPLPLALPEAVLHAADIDGLRFSAVPDMPKVTSAALRICGLHARYSGRAVLEDFSLDLGAGQLTALIGANGAGKTTLLRTIVGLLPQERGQVLLGEQDISTWDVAARCRHIGFLPQDPDLLLFADTVAAELSVTLGNHGLVATGQSADLLARLGLTPVREVYPRDLSVGERQRVALASVSVTQPTCLLLDEPTRGLDMPRKMALGELLRSWCVAGMSVLLVTHDVEWVACFAERVVLLEQGRVLDDGAPSIVLPAHTAFAPQMARLFPHAAVITVAQVSRRVG